MNLFHPVVEHEQLAVGNFPQKRANLLLCQCVKWKVRSDYIIVEVVEVLVQKIFEHIDVLLMQAYRDFRIVVQSLQH